MLTAFSFPKLSMQLNYYGLACNLYFLQGTEMPHYSHGHRSLEINFCVPYSVTLIYLTAQPSNTKHLIN